MLNKLEVKNLQKKYNKKIVLNNISFNIENSGVYLIAGPNGSGKITLLEILLLIRKSSGGEFNLYENGKLLKSKV